MPIIRPDGPTSLPAKHGALLDRDARRHRSAQGHRVADGEDFGMTLNSQVLQHQKPTGSVDRRAHP